VRRFLIPLARRLSEANLMARAIARRDADLILPPAVVSVPRRVTAIAPHADDEAIGCGGTLALAAEASVIFLTAPGERRNEALASCEVLGVRETRFLDFTDGQLPETPGAEAALAEALRQLAPEVLLVPWPLESHPDHAAAARLAARVAKHVGGPAIWCYEVWSPLDPNVLVDISSVVDVKREAIGRHASQVAQLDYADATLGLNRYRSLLAPGATHAEAFLACDAEALLRLSEPS
jgi:LmbE family N-acetylglucosaminyl deacetylase